MRDKLSEFWFVRSEMIGDGTWAKLICPFIDEAKVLGNERIYFKDFGGGEWGGTQNEHTADSRQQRAMKLKSRRIASGSFSECLTFEEYAEKGLEFTSLISLCRCE